MARRKKIVEQNYDELIKVSEERIEKLTTELKAERVNLKQLKKDKIAYDQAIEERKKQEEIREVAELIAESGKTIEEIKKLINK